MACIADWGQATPTNRVSCVSTTTLHLKRKRSSSAGTNHRPCRWPRISRLERTPSLAACPSKIRSLSMSCTNFCSFQASNNKPSTFISFSVSVLNNMKKLLKKLGKRPVNDARTDPQSTNPQEAVSERFGLLLLAESTPKPENRETYPVDIIAVHGLNGDAYATWKHDNQTLWLRDLLPSFLPGSRVFTFGYPSQLAFSTSFARVQEYSRRLLSSIRDIQEDSNEVPSAIVIRISTFSREVLTS